MLKDTLIRTTEQKILSLFVLNPDKLFYGRELSKKARVSLGATSNALRLFKKNGILVSEKKGKTSLYKLKLPNPYIERFKVLNTLLLIEPLVERLKGISRRIILYGSYATGAFTSESDLDILLVSERREGAAKILETFRAKVNFQISAVIKNQVEWMKLEKESPDFFNEVNSGIILWEKPINESGL